MTADNKGRLLDICAHCSEGQTWLNKIQQNGSPDPLQFFRAIFSNPTQAKIKECPGFPNGVCGGNKPGTPEQTHHH